MISKKYNEVLVSRMPLSWEEKDIEESLEDSIQRRIDMLITFNKDSKSINPSIEVNNIIINSNIMGIANQFDIIYTVLIQYTYTED